MKLGQKFAYEHGITFQFDQRMHILIYQTEEVFNYIGFCFVLKSHRGWLNTWSKFPQFKTIEFQHNIWSEVYTWM